MRSIVKGSVGTIVGETTPTAFKFLISKEVGRGTYIKAKGDGREWILAQIEDIKRSNTAYTVNQLNDAARNYDSREMMIAESRVIGVESNGKLHLPTSPARPGESVFLADEKLIKATLGLSKGDMYIGMLKGYDIRVEMDANTLVQKHCSVLAKTGSGKSYTAAVILEELLDRKVALLVIDPHGEYASMKEPNNVGDFSKYKVKPRGYDITVYTPGEMAMNPRADRPFRFNSLNLSAREVAKMIPNESSSSGQLGLLYEAISALRAETDAYTLEDIIEQVVRSNSKVKWNLVGQLESLLELGLFSGTATPCDELLRPGRAAVIDMTGIIPELQAMIVARLLTDIFEARKRRLISPGMVVVEEAHNYIPERGTGNAASTNIVRTIAAEGRKFGLGLMIISQRPARVDKNVISQCNTQIIMRVTNPNDLKALSKGLEGMTTDLEEEIKRLPAGVAMLVSNEIERPITVNIRPRKSRHGGVSTEIVSREKAKASSVQPARALEKRSRPQSPESSGNEKPVRSKKSQSSGGLLKKVFGRA
ncbi:MAG: ATP-binding protein [Methanothrix soehngenii]|uniref:helicase HerA domain-containing protein n=1 Tax=Methanothrix soehngenii TaxID=2223 RepID=UPI0023F26CBD|nr:ATP-binding protein [Methanothrix soehngenii]MCK9586209.1 ATP-binding protein [Methanothrix soehngenii]MDD5257245.1 ATP-binding protein [Methanothrix soehngenii]MDD5735105.1 ATP-binding protein [Methanothrix soehngenii]HOI20852.1 ATP-binding protein [Methanothrix soehngenii]